MKMFLALIFLCYVLSFGLPTLAEQCGEQAGGAICPGRLCCSKFGWCGRTDEYCGDGCQSNCNNIQLFVRTDVRQLISKQTFQKMMFLYGNPASAACPNTYEAFITAAKSFPTFGKIGTIETRRRELDAFLAQSLRATTGDNLASENDAVSYFKTAIWFWMSPQSLPSNHQLITNQWNSTSVDILAN